MKKVLKNIQLTTAPNGYTLKIDGNEYFYFNEVDLLAGFIARIGSGESKEMEKEDILNTMFNVMLGQKYAKEIDKLNDTVARLTTLYNDRIDKLAKEIKVIDEAIEKHTSMKKQLEAVTKLAKEMHDGYEEACKPYNEYKKRINDLEKDTGRMEDHFKQATVQANSMLTFIRETIDHMNADERLLRARADQLLKKEVAAKNGDTAADATETPDDDVLEVKASNSKVSKKKPVTKREKKPKADKPKKKTGDDTKTTRQKRDEAILTKIEEQLKENPNIK